MLRTNKLTVGCWVTLFGLCGCYASRSTPPDYVSTYAIDIARQSVESDLFWNVAKDVLRDHGFRLDRVDRREGIVTTLPVTSRQIFEFWRKDVRTRADAWEATLNPIRRWVEVRFEPDGIDTWRAIGVIVHKERFSSYDRQYNSTGASYQVFGSQLPTSTGRRRASEQTDRWLALGRDHALEDLILRRIAERVRLGEPGDLSAPLSHPGPEHQ